MISALIALPYELARLPMTLVDHTLSTRMAETSRPRATLHRAIGTTDKVAGALLGNPAIAQRGADRVERTAMLRSAARLEQEAATSREQARDTAAAGRQEAAQQRAAAQQTAASGLDEADAAEARATQEATTEAAKAASAKKKAADKRAASRTATVEQRKERVDAAAEKKQQGAQRAAKKKLDDARTTKQAAAGTRSDADRLGDLAETKKQARKQG